MRRVKYYLLFVFSVFLWVVLFLPSSLEAAETDSGRYTSYSWQNPAYSEQDQSALPNHTYFAQSIQTASSVEELRSVLRNDFDNRITDINIAGHGTLEGVTVFSPASSPVTDNSLPEPPDNEFYSTYKSGWGDATYYVEKTSDGGSIVATDCGGERRLRLVRTDSQGAQIWDKTYGSDWSSGRCIKQTGDGFIACGWLYSGSNASIGQITNS